MENHKKSHTEAIKCYLPLLGFGWLSKHLIKIGNERFIKNSNELPE